MRRATPLVFVLVAGALVAVDGETIAGVGQRLSSGVGRLRGAEGATLAHAEAVASTLATAQAALSQSARPNGAQAPLAGAQGPPPAAEAPADPDWGNLPDDAERDEQADATDDEAAEADEADEGHLDEGQRPDVLVSIGRETWIYAEPRWRSRRLGYLRAGAVVPRAPEPAGYRSCKRGWYRVEPRGYVCVGSRASLDPQHPIARLSARRPDPTGLPYPYVLSRFPTPPLYARLPSREQQQRAEPGLEHKLRSYQRLAEKPLFVPPPPAEPIPELLQNSRVLPGLGSVNRGSTVVLGPAPLRSGFALLGSYDYEGRRFGLTTDLALIPLDGTRVVAESTMHGVHLSEEFTLPLAFIKSRQARRYRLDEASGAMAMGAELAHRSALSLSGEQRRVDGILYLQARDGDWLRADQLVRIRPSSETTRWAKRGEKWIDISILQQSLVAYEGERPVFATLVSTGADGLMDHETTHATIRGSFLIHTKHVSVTMDGDEQGDEFDLRDVPYVQYFTEGYALHAAYWHDDFGTMRSHGCVNLAPVDAAWLFGWTDPQVPEGWHAALELNKGTVVYIHP